jgi:hypothetical protein
LDGVRSAEHVHVERILCALDLEKESIHVLAAAVNFSLGAFGIDQPGFSQTTPYVSTSDGFLTPATTLSNPFPSLQLPQGSSQGLATYMGQCVSFVNRDEQNPIPSATISIFSASSREIRFWKLDTRASMPFIWR